MPGILRIGGHRRILGLRRVVLLAEDLQAPVHLAIAVDIDALVLQGVLHPLLHGDRRHERTARLERILAFVSAVGTYAARAHDARRKVEHDLRALAHKELPVETLLLRIALAKGQRIAEGHVGAFDEPRIRRPAIVVEGNVVRVFRIGPGLDRALLLAREDDVAAQIPARHVVAHPADRIVDRSGIRIPGIEHIDVIAPVALVVLQQFGAVLRDPGLKRLGLELLGRDGLLLGAGGQRQQPGRTEVKKAGSELHIELFELLVVDSVNLSVLRVACGCPSLHRLHGEKEGDRALARDRAEIFASERDVVGHVGLDVIPLATSQ